MRDQMDVLMCDADDWRETIAGPAGDLADLAEFEGWQVEVVVHLEVGDEGPDLITEDRCPDHQLAPEEYLAPEAALAQAGGLGGLRPWDLRWPGGDIPPHHRPGSQ